MCFFSQGFFSSAVPIVTFVKKKKIPNILFFNCNCKLIFFSALSGHLEIFFAIENCTVDISASFIFNCISMTFWKYWLEFLCQPTLLILLALSLKQQIVLTWRLLDVLQLFSHHCRTIVSRQQQAPPKKHIVYLLVNMSASHLGSLTFPLANANFNRTPREQNSPCLL